MVYRGVLREPHPSCALTARVHRGVCIVPGTRLRCLRFWVFFLCIRLRLGIRRGVRVEAIALIKEYTPDLVFLDVQMPGLNGLGVIKKLVDRKLKVPHIIFATAYDNYAVNAFEVNAVDYVLKPFDKGRISKAIQRAKKMLEANSSPAERLETLVSQVGTAANVPQRVKLLVKSQQR